MSRSSAGAQPTAPRKGINVAQDILTANPDLKAIYSACGPPAAGPRRRSRTPSLTSRHSGRLRLLLRRGGSPGRGNRGRLRGPVPRQNGGARRGRAGEGDPRRKVESLIDSAPPWSPRTTWTSSSETTEGRRCAGPHPLPRRADGAPKRRSGKGSIRRSGAPQTAGTEGAEAERVRCSSLANWPVYPSLRDTCGRQGYAQFGPRLAWSPPPDLFCGPQDSGE